MKSVIQLEVDELVRQFAQQQHRELVVPDQVVTALTSKHGGLSPAEARRKSRRDMEAMLATIDRGETRLALAELSTERG